MFGSKIGGNSKLNSFSALNSTKDVFCLLLNTYHLVSFLGNLEKGALKKDFDQDSKPLSTNQAYLFIHFYFKNLSDDVY